MKRYPPAVLIPAAIAGEAVLIWLIFHQLGIVR